MTGDGALTPREARLVAAVVASPSATQQELASQVGCSDRFVRRMLAKPAVREALAAAVSSAMRTSVMILATGAVRAARYLVEVVDGAEPPNLGRVAAARAVLDHAQRAQELDLLETRLGDLEGRLLEAEGDDPGDPE